MSEISVIILTYNSSKFIKPCLDSVFRQGCEDFEVIVVDNGSQDATVESVRESYPSVKLLQNQRNLGAAKARNQGIEASKGEWILTIDCDIMLCLDFFSQARKAIEGLPVDVGVLAPKILSADRRTIYSAGILLSSLRRFYDLGRGQVDSAKFAKPRYVFGACSACAIYRKEMLSRLKEDTGYFDERFFFLVEDVDLAWRAKRIGWKALYYPQASCYHSGNSSGLDGRLRQYLCFRNRLLMISKNESLSGKLKLLPVFLIYDLPRMLFLLLNFSRLKKERKEVSE